MKSCLYLEIIYLKMTDVRRRSTRIFYYRFGGNSYYLSATFLSQTIIDQRTLMSHLIDMNYCHYPSFSK